MIYSKAFKLQVPLALIRTAFSRAFFAAIPLSGLAAIMSREINLGNQWKNTEEINSNTVGHVTYVHVTQTRRVYNINSKTWTTIGCFFVFFLNQEPGVVPGRKLLKKLPLTLLIYQFSPLSCHNGALLVTIKRAKSNKKKSPPIEARRKTMTAIDEVSFCFLMQPPSRP